MKTQLLLVSISFAFSLPSFPLPFPYTSISPFLLFQSVSLFLSRFQQLMSNNFGGTLGLQPTNGETSSLLPFSQSSVPTATLHLSCWTAKQVYLWVELP